jgi:hypothetical protein
MKLIHQSVPGIFQKERTNGKTINGNQKAGTCIRRGDRGEHLPVKNKKGIMVKKKKNGDKNELVSIDITHEIISNLVTRAKATNKYKFYLYRMFGFSTGEACKATGLKVSYGYRLNHELKNDPQIRGNLERVLVKFPDHYRNLCRARLIEIAEVEGKALDEYQRDPRLAIKSPKLLRDIKNSAGAIEHDIPMIQTNINIASLHSFLEDLLPDPITHYGD